MLDITAAARQNHTTPDTLSLAAPTQPLEPAAPLKCCSCEPMVSSAQLRVLATLLISLLRKLRPQRPPQFHSAHRPANTQPTKTLAVYEPGSDILRTSTSVTRLRIL